MDDTAANTQREVLDVRAVAAYLGKSQDAVRSLILRGRIPAAKLGRTYIVRRCALEQHLASLEQEFAAQHARSTGRTPRVPWKREQLLAITHRHIDAGFST